MQKRFFLLGLFLMLAFVSATVLQPTTSDMTISVFGNNVFIDYTIKTTQQELCVPIFDFKELIYINANTDFNYHLNKNINCAYVSMSNKKQNKILVLKYQATNLSRNFQYLDKTFVFENQFANLDVMLNLDKNLSYVEPKFENGFYSFKKGKTFIFLRFKEENAFSLEEYIALIMIGLLLIYFIGFFLYRKYKFLKINKKTKNGLLLTENEKKIITLLKKHEGIIQQTIATMTGLSKNRVSKILAKLERKDIVEMKKVGKVKKVFIK